MTKVLLLVSYYFILMNANGLYKNSKGLKYANYGLVLNPYNFYTLLGTGLLILLLNLITAPVISAGIVIRIVTFNNGKT